jgi:hypothetical protein
MMRPREMLNDPPVVRKLIPRLASPFDAEVVATAHAIIKALAADNFDLHDLAKMADAAPAHRARDLGETEYASRVRARLKEILLEPWPDTWTREFIDSILDRPNLDALSTRQISSSIESYRSAAYRGDEEFAA